MNIEGTQASLSMEKKRNFQMKESVKDKVYDMWNSQERKDYENACKEMQPFLNKKNLVEPKEIKKKYNNALKNYRKFLDKMGNKLPISRYPYDHQDPFTWKYLDCVVTDDKQYIKMIINPHWIYLKKYQNDIMNKKV